MRTMVGTVLALTLAATNFASGTTAAAEPQSGPVLNLPLEGETTGPDWRTKPSGDDLVREYPPLAQMLMLGGHATITCQAEIDGRVDECRIVSETPAGVGFGAATLRAAAYFTMNPATLDGKPIRSSVTIPLNWQLAPGTGQAPPTGDPPLPTVSPASLELARKIVALEDTAGRIQANWQPALDRQAAEIVANGEAQSGQVALDALRQGLVETVSAEVERRAHYLAAQMKESELRSTVAFLETQSGKAWVTADESVDRTVSKDFMMRLSRAARAHLCAQTNCGQSGSSPVASAAR